MNIYSLATLGIMAMTLGNVSVPMDSNSYQEEAVKNSRAETRANITIADYIVENVTDEGFDFIIKFDSDLEVTSLSLPYWKNGNYGGMKWHTNVQKIGTNQFKAHIKMKDIGSGTEYVYVGIHPITSQGEVFLRDIPLRLDTNNPNLNASLSNTAWTNKNININANATDNMNIIERINFTDKSGQVTSENLYSNPKILLIVGYGSSAIQELIGSNPNVTSIEGTSITSVSQLKGYDVIIYDGRYWGIDSNVSNALNQAFEEGVSIITNLNDDYENISIGGGSGTAINMAGSYVFKNNVVGEGNFNGRLNRFAYLMDGQVESDSGYRKISPGEDAFVISTATHDDGTTTPAILMETHSNGNKWIHFQASDKVVVSGTIYRAIDEIMCGTMKTRQTYNKSYEISENGTYYVEVEDFSGNKTKREVVVSNIDKVAPTMTITGNPTTWSKSATLVVTGSDNLSGVKQIVLPDGNVVNDTKATFTTTKNGDYTFKVVDNAGNEYSQTVSVTKVDSTIDYVSVLSSNMEIINSNTSERKLSIAVNNIIDSQSGFKGYSYVIDKVASTVPDNIVDTTTNLITKNITDSGVYYLHIKAIDNAGNVSNIVHHKIDVPALTAQAKTSNNMIRLDWTLSDSSNKTFKVYQKKDGSSEFQSIGATNFNDVKEVKVLNVYPPHSTVETYTTWKGETVTLPISASLKRWMEEPNAENSKGYGKGIISVDTVLIDDFNSNPDSYLKNSDGSYKYDVIMFGTLDNNGTKDLSTLSLESTKLFIESGRGVLFGHDTVTQWGKRANFSKLEDYINVKTYGFNATTDWSAPEQIWNVPWSGGTEVSITKKGILTNYPWNIGEIGTILNIPYTHTNSQIAKGDVWMKFSNPTSDLETRVPISTEEYSDNGVGTNMAYLTSYNNTAMIQTGHAINRYSATSDEQKVLANTLFYLNQLSTDTFLDDYSGQDVEAPTKPTLNNYIFNNNRKIQINFNSKDIGSEYQYYIESENKENEIAISNVVAETITSGIKGYSYVIDTKADTIPSDVVNTTSESFSITAPSNSFYVHIKAIDNADNIGETLHYKIEDLTKPTLSITGNPTTWTKNNVVLNVTATDTGSGIQEIILPNGNKVTSLSASYTVSANGSYTFKAIDKLGNETVQTVVVDKIDKTINDIKNLSYNMEMINTDTSERKITIDFDDITDSQSGLKGYSYVIDKVASTVPDDTVDTTNSLITKNITDSGVYYVHIKAIDNAGNVSSIIHHKIDIPVLTATAKPNEDMIRLDWTLDDKTGKTFKVYQKKENSNEFQSISTTNFNDVKQVKVLNIYPGVGDIISFTTWDGENISIPKSGNLKEWMEKPNAENPKGYGKGIIEVDSLTVDEFNANPTSALKNADGTWKYDVIYVGHWDCNNHKVPNDEGLELFVDFIDDGRGFLAGHDTIGFDLGTTKGLSKIREKFNIKVGYWSSSNMSTDEGFHYLAGHKGTSVTLQKKGLLTNYPWNIGDVGTVLTTPLSHSTSNFAFGDIWLTYSEKWPSYNAPAELDKYNNFYLTTWNNTAMIQTGHSNGNATADEQKLLANTLFYLNQLSNDNYLDDNSGQDTEAPNKPTIYEHNFLDSGEVEIKFNEVEDNGSEYEYYVKSEDKLGNISLSNVVKTEIKSGLKGYSYVVDSNANTIPDDIIETSTAKTIKVKNSSNSLYVHIKAIDNVGNSSETIHYKISDIIKPTLELSLTPTSWTNGNVTISVKATDSESGIKEIILPNGNVINSTITSYTVSANGVYYFKAIDRIGNETTSFIKVSNIDKNKPTVTIQNNTNWTNQDVQVIITGTDE